MPVSPASASSEREGSRVLIVGLNWLGDAIMGLPALAVLRARAPEAHFTLLTRPALSGLWSLFPGVDRVACQQTGFSGTFRTAGAIRTGRYDTAWVLPRSFRSAFLVWSGGVRERVGLAGHGRDWMLTRVVRPDENRRRHQVQEYLDLVRARPEEVPSGPFLKPSEAAVAAAREAYEAWAGGAAALVGMFPGAARGPSKRWPAERFGQVARDLTNRHGCRVAVFGTAGDAESCAAVAAAAGERAINLAGRTGIDALAGWLRLCRVVVANDSGGMHLAAGLGIPVVGIFGMTDPERTGPVGTGHRLIAAEGIAHARDIPRDSEPARRAMLSIEPNRVYAAAESLLRASDPGH